MKRTILLSFGILLSVTVAAMAQTLAELDRLHEADRHQQVVALIDARLNLQHPPHTRAELLWRKARAQLTVADYGRWNGTMTDAGASELLRQAEAHCDEAIELAPDSAEPHFWKAATMGLRGQIRGVLNSLFMASDIRDHAVEAIKRNDRYNEAYYLLGQLFRELPGRPISFGNRDAAVSLSRKAVFLHEVEYNTGVVAIRYYDNYTQLAEALWRRNGSAERRRQRHAEAAREYRNATSALERGASFEGTVPLPPGSDRDESLRLIRMVVSELSRVSVPADREQKDLESAEKLLSAWR